MRIIVLRTSGAEELHQTTAAGWLIDVGQLLGGNIETHSLLRSADAKEKYGMRHPVMICRDDGYETTAVEREIGAGKLITLQPTHARLPMNAKATALYRSVGGQYPVVGDVALVDDEEL